MQVTLPAVGHGSWMASWITGLYWVFGGAPSLVFAGYAKVSNLLQTPEGRTFMHTAVQVFALPRCKHGLVDRVCERIAHSGAPRNAGRRRKLHRRGRRCTPWLRTLALADRSFSLCSRNTRTRNV